MMSDERLRCEEHDADLPCAACRRGSGRTSPVPFKGQWRLVYQEQGEERPGEWVEVDHPAVLDALGRDADPRLNADVLLREVVGDDDPRTFDEDGQWRETLAGKAEHDHIEISIYAGTLRRILERVRGLKLEG
jgi:hypothetical protein